MNRIKNLLIAFQLYFLRLNIINIYLTYKMWVSNHEYPQCGFVPGAGWWFSKWKGGPRRTRSRGVCKQLKTYVLVLFEKQFWNSFAVQFLSHCYSEQIWLDLKALSCSELDKSWKSSDCTYMSTWSEGELIVSTLLFFFLKVLLLKLN